MEGTRSCSGPGCDDYYHTGKNQPTYVDLGWAMKKGLLYCFECSYSKNFIPEKETNDSSTIFDVEPRDWEERVLTRINHEYKNTEKGIISALDGYAESFFRTRNPYHFSKLGKYLSHDSNKVRNYAFSLIDASVDFSSGVHKEERMEFFENPNSITLLKKIK